MNKIIFILLLCIFSIAFAQAQVQNIEKQNATVLSIEKKWGVFSGKWSKGLRLTPQSRVLKAPRIPQINVLQIDSSYKFNWDSTAFNWKMSAKTISNFDSQGVEIDRITKTLAENGSWENTSKLSFSTIANDNIELNMLWFNGDWENYAQKTSTYDSSKNNTSIANKQWDPMNQNWVINSMQTINNFDINNNLLTTTTEMWISGMHFSSVKTSNTYYDNNNPKASLTEEWSFLTNTWTKSDSSSYSYNIDNKLSIETNFIRNADAWANETETQYFYDSSNHQTQVLFRKWDGINWVNDTQYNQMLWANGVDMPLSFTTQTWVNNAWKDENRVSTALDANLNQTSSLVEKWTGSSWVINNQSLSSYNANQQKLTDSNKIWNEQGTKILYGDSTSYFIGSVAAQLKNLEIDDRQVFVYPACNHGNFVVTSTQNDINSIELISATGQTVYAKFNINQPIYNLTVPSFHKGMYILRIKHGTKVSTRKIVSN